MRILRWPALLLLVATTTVVALSPVIFDRQPASIDLTLPLWYLVSGLVVMLRRPWHQVGWLLIALGLGLAWTNIPPAPARLGESWHPWLTWVTGSWGGYFGYTALVALLVVFPDGLARRPHRDRVLGRRIVGLMALLTLVSAASDPVSTNESFESVVSYPNPLGLSLIPQAASDLGFIPVILIAVGCVIWMWRRQRREDGEARRRYTLVLFTFAVLVVALAFGISLSGSWGDNAWFPAFFAWFAVPVSFAVAVVRHGLYGVDRLVRRTVTYGLVGAVTAAVYAVPVVSLPRLLGESNDLVIAASTLAAAAVFDPTRRRIRSRVDRRFDRARYDAQREVDLFAERLTGEVGLDLVVDDLNGVLHRTVSPSSARMWLREPAEHVTPS